MYVIVGCGYWGSKLARVAYALWGPQRLVVAEPDEHRRAWVRSTFPALRTFPSLGSALVATPTLEGAIIAAPLAQHFSLASEALDSDLHILVEKPIAASAGEARLLVDKARVRSRTLVVGHTFLSSPRVRKLRSIVQDASFGEMSYISSSRLNLGIHRPDADVLWDLGPHDVSIAMFLTGELPAFAIAVGRRPSLPRPSDTAFLTLEFPSGVIANIGLSWLAPRKVRQVIVAGTGRMAIYDEGNDDEPVKVVDRGVVVPDSHDYGQNRLTYRYGDTVSPFVSTDEPIRIQLEDFDRACHGFSSDVVSDGRFGLAVVAVLEAATRSMSTGRRIPVSVEADENCLAS